MSIDDDIQDMEFFISMYALEHLKDECLSVESFDLADAVVNTWHSMSNAYIEFREDKYPEETDSLLNYAKSIYDTKYLT